MKKCKHCGALQGDEKNFCIDCGEWLGAPLTKQQEASEDRKVTDNITKLYNKRDYFYVSKLDKTAAVLLMIGAFISLLLRILFGTQVGYPFVIILTLAIPLMAIEAIDLLLPWISWELYKLKFVFSVNNPDDMEPSEFMLYVRRITSYTTAICGYLFLIFVIIKLLIG